MIEQYIFKKLTMKRKNNSLTHLILIVLNVLCFFNVQAQKASFIFRMDDIVLQSDSMQDSVLALFAKHQVSLNWGVIPFAEDSIARDNADSSFINIIQKATAQGQLELLLHGYSHTRNPNSATKSEFHGLSLQKQIEKLTAGTTYIKEKFNLPVQYFAPPWNTYDKNTLQALQKTGFKGISADLGGVSKTNGLAYLPCTKIDFENWDKVLQQSNFKQGVVVVLFHSYTFTDSGFSLQQLDTILSQTIANGNKCYTFSGYTQQASVFPSSYRYQLNAKLRYSRLFFFLPNRAQHWVFLENSYIFITTFGIIVFVLIVGIYLGIRKFLRFKVK